MSTISKGVTGIVVCFVVLVVGVFVAAKFIDINQYRSEIADTLTKQTGRTVTLAGEIHLNLSLKGVGLEVEDVSIGNPAWASRADMAKIGRLNVGVELMPLINHRIVVSELDIKDADILMETSASDQHNWDLKPISKTPSAAVAPQETVSSGSQATTPAAAMPSVHELSIVNSQLGIRDKSGKVSLLKLEKLSLSPEHEGSAVVLAADYNGTPIKLSFKTTEGDLMAAEVLPADIDLTYGAYRLQGTGSIDVHNKGLVLKTYELTAGASSLTGSFSASSKGSRTEVEGSLKSAKLNPDDFKGSASAAPSETATEAAPPSTPAAASSGRLFSTTPLNLSALNTIDAKIDIAIDELDVAKGALKNVAGKIVLSGGKLSISPFGAQLGTSAMSGLVTLDASNPPRYSLSFKAPGVDIATLLEMLGTKAFMTGKGDAVVDLAGQGASPHDLASSTNGKIEITAENGTISASLAGGVASGLAEIFSPGASNPTLNCVAVRFNVAGGVGKDNGILADSSASTVAGSGGFDLGAETVDLALLAKPKLVSTGSITPGVKIKGPLMSPSIGLDTSGLAQNVAGMLAKGATSKLGGSLGGLLGGVSGSATTGGVPTMAQAPAGQNACIYTLDNKSATPAPATASTNAGVKDVAGQAAAKVKSGGKQLLQGLFGH